MKGHSPQCHCACAALAWSNLSLAASLDACLLIHSHHRSTSPLAQFRVLCILKFQYSLCPRLKVILRLPVVDHPLQFADARAKSATIVNGLPEIVVACQHPAPPSGPGQSGSSSTRNRCRLPSSSPHRGPDQSVSSSTRNRCRLPSYSPPRGPDQSSSSSNQPPDAPADGRSGDLSSLTMDQLVEVIRAEIQRPSAVNQAPAARDFPLPPTSQGDACS